MFKDKKIGVVVPAYNEEKLISRVIETIPEYFDKIIVVDDCSKDKTVEIVKKFKESMGDKLVLIEHEKNEGVGGAIASGYKWARDNKIDVSIVMAGDAQMNPGDLPNLLEPVVNGEVDYAKGNRLFTGDAWRQIPKIRYLGNSFLSLFTKIASGYWHIADSQSGYTAVSLKVLETIDLDRIYKRYGMPNDLLVKLNVYNFRVRDVLVTPVYNIGEKSGIKIWKIIPQLSYLLIKWFLWRMKEKYIIRDFHPLVFFYLFGIFLFLLGGALGFIDFIHRLFLGPVASTSALFDAFLIITGLQMLLFGMWFDMESNRDLK